MAWTPVEAKARRAEILAALEAAGGNVTKTAEALKITRQTLYTHAYQLGLEKEFGLGKERRPERPSTAAEDLRVSVTVKLPESLWAWTRILAIQEKRSAADVVQDALERMRAELEAKDAT